MKILLDQLSSDFDAFIPGELFGNVIKEVPCVYENCDGKVNFLLKQTRDASAVICNKCKRAVVVKVTEV